MFLFWVSQNEVDLIEILAFAKAIDGILRLIQVNKNIASFDEKERLLNHVFKVVGLVWVEQLELKEWNTLVNDWMCWIALQKN